MQIPKSLFMIYCSVLVTGLIWSYAKFKDYFSEQPEVVHELAVVKNQLEQERFEKSIIAYRLKDFERSVAEVLPSEKKNTEKKMYAVQNWMSSLREPASLPKLDMSSVVYESIKSKFKEKKYDLTIDNAKKLIDTYPTSRHVVEAHFFVAESYFLKNDLKKCIETIDLMTAQFPDHDLTGFILLRLGQISEKNSQPEEAREIYSVVEKQFQNPALKNQAQLLMRNLK